jgi:hypothetical protein
MFYTSERGLTQVTADHDVIRQWVIQRHGRPAVVEKSQDDEGGILRIDLGDIEARHDLVPVAWDDWFKEFEKADLAFLYQEETPQGEVSRYNELVERVTVEDQL